MTWAQFLAKYLVNDWGTKRGVPPPAFAGIVALAYVGLITRQQARAAIRAL